MFKLICTDIDRRLQCWRINKYIEISCIFAYHFRTEKKNIINGKYKACTYGPVICRVPFSSSGRNQICGCWFRH